MNAHTPTPHALTPLVLQNETLLRAIAAINTPQEGPPTTIMDLAAATGRDDSNVGKSLKALTAEGLIVREPRIALTMAGGAVLAALDRAAGRVVESWPLDATPADTIALTADRMAPDPANPRRRSGLTPASIEDMAASIRERVAAGLPGLITPPTVRPPVADDGPWRINMGERRWRGWTLAVSRGWIDADATFACPVFRGDDAAALDGAVVENVQREDLDDLELGEVFLAYDRIGLAVADICRRLGKTSPDPVRQASYERWVQERLKVAREADPRAKDGYIASRAAEAAGIREAQPFTWTMLRDSVKAPKHLTALDKTPHLRLLLLEMAFIAETDGDTDSWVPITPHPPGGILDVAHDLDLVERGAPWPNLAPAARLRPKAIDWLADQGWEIGSDPDDDEALITQARIAALGPIGAASLAPGMAATDFLNPPSPPAGASEGVPLAAEPGSTHPLAPGATTRAIPGEPVAGGEAKPSSATEPSPPPPPPTPGGEPLPEAAPSLASGRVLSDDDDDETEIPDFLRRLAGAPANPPRAAGEGDHATRQGGGANHGGGVSAGVTDSAPDPLTLRQRLIIVEVAHKITTAGEWAGDATRGAPADGFHTDPMVGGLMPKWISFAQRQSGLGFLVTLTSTARAWLAEAYPAGIDIGDVFDAQAHAGVFDAGSSYATAWLREPEPATNIPPPEGEGDHAEHGGGGDADDSEPAPEPAPPLDLNPVRLMREALAGLYLTSSGALDAINAVLAADDEDATAAAVTALANHAHTLQRALFTAAEFVPAVVKAWLETSDHD